jgi:hypothetical protein
MKKLGLSLIAMGALASTAFAGSDTYSGKEMKQVSPAPPQCPEWYADNEWNVSLWGTYAFTGTDANRGSLDDVFFQAGGNYDRFLGDDHAWGGGVDAKYFFQRYFGVGIEGFGLGARGSDYDIENFGAIAFNKGTDHHAIGGVLGTVTLRYPIPCTRFSPYVWGGGGGLFNGFNDRAFHAFGVAQTVREDRDSKGMGQFGGGLEVRITPHIGWVNDFSWNLVDGPHNDFGMVRTGINFAF